MSTYSTSQKNAITTLFYDSTLRLNKGTGNYDTQWEGEKGLSGKVAKWMEDNGLCKIDSKSGKIKITPKGVKAFEGKF